MIGRGAVLLRVLVLVRVLVRRPYWAVLRCRCSLLRWQRRGVAGASLLRRRLGCCPKPCLALPQPTKQPEPTAALPERRLGWSGRLVSLLLLLLLPLRPLLRSALCRFCLCGHMHVHTRPPVRLRLPLQPSTAAAVCARYLLVTPAGIQALALAARMRGVSVVPLHVTSAGNPCSSLRGVWTDVICTAAASFLCGGILLLGRVLLALGHLENATRDANQDGMERTLEQRSMHTPIHL